jgi:hypothetical protein
MVRSHVTVQGLCERKVTHCFTDLKDNLKEFKYFYKSQTPYNTNFYNIKPTLLNVHEMKVYYSISWRFINCDCGLFWSSVPQFSVWMKGYYNIVSTNVISHWPIAEPRVCCMQRRSTRYCFIILCQKTVIRHYELEMWVPVNT